MSRKALLFIIIFVIILLSLLGGFYYYLKTKSTTTTTGETKSLTLRDFFPFGSTPDPTPTSGATSTDSNTSIQTNNTKGNTQQGSDTNPTAFPVLRHITEFPIAGAIIFDRVVSTSTTASTTAKNKTVVKKEITNAIRYMERATGYIYETATTTLSSARISNTTFPKVYEALFDGTGENLVARTLKNDDGESILTYYGHLNKEIATSTDEKLTTTLLSEGISMLVSSPLKERIFSLGSTGGEKGVISSFDGSKKSIIWTSLLTEWLPTWTSEDTIVLSTKPSANVSGVAYFLSIASKSFRKIGTSLPGLTISVSPTLANILYAQSDVRNKSIIFGLMDKTGKAPQPLSLKTLPEKCVWSLKEKSVAFCAVPDSIPSANYPDDWYSGKVSFIDSIWKINMLTGEVRDIAPIREMVREDIDAINLSLDTKEDYLLFTNKKDLSLWGLQIKTTIISTATATTT